MGGVFEAASTNDSDVIFVDTVFNPDDSEILVVFVKDIPYQHSLMDPDLAGTRSQVRGVIYEVFGDAGPGPEVKQQDFTIMHKTFMWLILLIQ